MPKKKQKKVYRYSDDERLRLQSQDFERATRVIVAVLHKSGAHGAEAIDIAQETYSRVFEGRRPWVPPPDLNPAEIARHFLKHVVSSAKNVLHQQWRLQESRNVTLLEDLGDHRRIAQVEEVARRLDQHAILPEGVLVHPEMIVILRRLCAYLHSSNRKDLAAVLRAEASITGNGRARAEALGMEYRQFYRLRHQLKRVAHTYLGGVASGDFGPRKGAGRRGVVGGDK